MPRAGARIFAPLFFRLKKAGRRKGGTNTPRALCGWKRGNPETNDSNPAKPHAITRLGLGGAADSVGGLGLVLGFVRSHNALGVLVSALRRPAFFSRKKSGAKILAPALGTPLRCVFPQLRRRSRGRAARDVPVPSALTRRPASFPPPRRLRSAVGLTGHFPNSETQLIHKT